MRSALIVAGATLAVVGGVGAWSASTIQWSIPVRLADGAQSIAYANQVLASGATPADWPNRVFVPASAIKQLSTILVGTELIIPNGETDAEGRVDGAFVAHIDALTLETREHRLTPQVTATIRYEPDRISPWWSKAQVRATIDADFLPTAGTGHTPARLKIVPRSIRLSPVWSAFSVGTGAMVSEAIAAKALDSLGERLAIPIPPLVADLHLDLSLTSRGHALFRDGGGFDFVAQLNGPHAIRTISAPYLLVTDTGLWMLGGRGIATPAVPAPLKGDLQDVEIDVQSRSRELAKRLEPFTRRSEDAELRISNQPFLDMAKEIAGAPSAARSYRLDLSSQHAHGVIASAFVLKDNLLGDVGVTITPQHQEFISGSAQIAAGSVSWAADNGLSTTLVVQATATAAVHAHMSTGTVGGGIGRDVTIKGVGRATIPVSVTIARVSAGAADVFVLQPTIGCTPMKLEATTGLDAGIAKIGTFGVRISRNVGGVRTTPAVLLDSLPRNYRVSDSAIEPGAKPLAALRFPHRSVELRWGHRQVGREQAWWEPRWSGKRAG